jgi:Xaa-Pro aminopeptidase
MNDRVVNNLTNSLPYFQAAFSLEEFQRRRSRVCEAIGDAVAVVQGFPATGAMDLFRQHNDFFYLCGVEAPHAYLVIEGRSEFSTLYLPPADAHLAETDGPEINSDDAELARQLCGVSEIKPLTALADDLRSKPIVYACQQRAEGRQACQDSIRCACRLGDLDPWRSDASQEVCFAETLSRHLGQVDLRDLSPILNELRRLKSHAEVKVMRRAGEITAIAVCEAIRSTEPGLLESQLAAIAEYVFLVNGARGGGYRPIVASGENIWNMHYYHNNCRLTDGDMVLFDYAPDYAYYTSDIGRIWPVNGKYAPWQRELYGFVVDYHLTLLDLIGPGKTPRQIRDEASTRLGPIVSRTRWSKPQFRDAVEKLITTSRALTHTVGMAVHDESGFQNDDRELEPGLVFALDPQLWVPEERLYIRVEDNVVVNDSGVENLTPTAPHAPDEVEQLMTEQGLLQSRPDLLLEVPRNLRAQQGTSIIGGLAFSPI